MWIAHSLVEFDSVVVPYDSELLPERPSFRVFLSHRGMDAKADLAAKLAGSEAYSGVFLDCLRLPRGCVNRLFVYSSLVRSGIVYLIRTENFANSEWCLKEQRLAEYLGSKGRLDCRDFPSVEAAWSTLTREQRAPAEGLDMPAPAVAGPADVREASLGPLWIINSDFKGQDRAPNRNTLEGYQGFLSAVDHAVSLVGGAMRSSGQGRSSLASAIVEAVEPLLEQVVASTSRTKPGVDLLTFHGLTSLPTDVLIVFGQIVFGLVSIGTRTSNKVESRQAADGFLRMVPEFVELASRAETCKRERWVEYFVVMTVARALEFDRERRNDLPVEAGRRLCGDAATFKERHVLLDVRGRTGLAQFRLRLAAMLIRYGIGAVGIIQSASDTVHDESIDGFDLSVLPCITLYPGMAGMTGLDGDIDNQPDAPALRWGDFIGRIRRLRRP
jgi:hypothetical protein